MYALHELLCQDARVLNRHAHKMYGFVPGLIMAVHDKQKGRHQRGYQKIFFPGLQDQGGQDAPIMPWGRFIMPNAGGMLAPKKYKTVTIKVPKWTRTKKEIKDKIVREVKVAIKEKVKVNKPGKFADFQAQMIVNFQVDQPAEKDGFLQQSPATTFQTKSDAQAKAECKRVVAKMKEFFGQTDPVEDSKLQVYLDGHTSTTASGDHNRKLSNRRVDYVTQNYLLPEMNAQLGDDVANVVLSAKGYGEAYAGRIRRDKAPFDFIKNPADSNNPKCMQNAEQHPNVKKAANQNECDFCRRFDVTFDTRLMVKKGEQTEVEVIVGWKTEIKEEEVTRIIWEPKLEWVDKKIQVAEDGPASGTGFYSPPQIGDEVCCAFEHGDMHWPYIVGSVWNGQSEIPEPVSPADAKRDKKGPQTPSMKADSLSGGGGKNQIGFWKSRTGNLIELDDKNGVVRVQDRSGMSTIQLSKGKIEVMQTSGNLWFYAKETIRFDSENFVVEAKNNIWQHADKNYSVFTGKDQTINAKATWTQTVHGGGMYEVWENGKWVQKHGHGISYISKGTGGLKIGANRDLTITAKAAHTKHGWGNKIQSSVKNVGFASKDSKLELEAKADIKFTTFMKFTSGCEKDLTIKSGGMINFSGLTNIKWKGENVLLNAGGSPAGGLSLGKIIGAIIRGAKALAGAIGKGVVAAAKAVAGAAKAAAGAVAGAVGAAASALGKVVGAVTKAVGAAAAAVGNAAKAVGAAVGKAAGAVAKAAAGAVAAAGNALKNAAGAVADVAKGAFEGAKNLFGGAIDGLKNAAGAVAKAGQAAIQKVGEVAAAVKDGVVKAAGDAMNGLKDLGQKAIDGAKNLAGQAMALGQQAIAKAGELVNGAKDAFMNAAGALKDAAGKGIGALKDAAGAVVDAGKKAAEMAGNAFNAFKDGVGNAMGAAGEALGKAAAEAQKLAAQALDDVRNGAANAVEGAGKAVADGTKAVADAIRPGGAGNGVPAGQQAQNGTGQVAVGRDLNIPAAGQDGGGQNPAQGGGGQGNGVPAGQQAQQGAGQVWGGAGAAGGPPPIGPGGRPMVDAHGNAPPPVPMQAAQGPKAGQLGGDFLKMFLN